MSIKNVRQSRTDHPMPVFKSTREALTERVAAKYSDGQRPQKSVLMEREGPGKFPTKSFPRPGVENFPLTPPPVPNTRDGKGEGKIRGRQADKSSKSK